MRSTLAVERRSERPPHGSSYVPTAWYFERIRFTTRFDSTAAINDLAAANASSRVAAPMTQPNTILVKLPTVAAAADRQLAPWLKPEAVLLPMISLWPTAESTWYTAPAPR